MRIDWLQSSTLRNNGFLFDSSDLILNMTKSMQIQSKNNGYEYKTHKNRRRLPNSTEKT
jgi:hypothetical protein